MANEAEKIDCYDTVEKRVTGQLWSKDTDGSPVSGEKDPPVNWEADRNEATLHEQKIKRALKGTDWNIVRIEGNCKNPEPMRKKGWNLVKKKKKRTQTNKKYQKTPSKSKLKVCSVRALDCKVSEAKPTLLTFS